MPDALPQTNRPPATAKLAPPRDLLPPTFWQAHRWEIAGALWLVFIGLIAWICFRRRARRVLLVPAASYARRELEALRGRNPGTGLPVEISRVIRRFVTSRFGLPPGELTTGELRRALPEAGVPAESANLVGDFLRRCDEIKFAPGATAGETDLIADALQLVDRLEAGGAK